MCAARTSYCRLKCFIWAWLSWVFQRLQLKKIFFAHADFWLFWQTNLGEKPWSLVVSLYSTEMPFVMPVKLQWSFTSAIHPGISKFHSILNHKNQGSLFSLFPGTVCLWIRLAFHDRASMRQDTSTVWMTTAFFRPNREIDKWEHQGYRFK